MNTVLALNKWLYRFRPDSSTRLRLFCFPFAGGGASVFNDWADLLPPTIQICAVQLPGRENRFCERPFEQMDELVAALSVALRPYLDVPFAFWGHSMGALVCFEVARQLHRTRQPMPRHMFVSACGAPHLPLHVTPTSNLSDAEFIEEIVRLNGTPIEVVQNSELMQLLLPMLRADFRMLELYQHTIGPPLNVPITALGGQQDAIVTPAELEAWQHHTQQSFCKQMFAGGHFYFHQYRDEIAAIITEAAG